MKWYNNIDFLFEGRLEDVKKKYVSGGLMTKEIEEYVDYFSENDPSGNNKYLAWMCKQFFENSVEGQSLDPWSDDNGFIKPSSIKQYAAYIVSIVNTFDHHVSNLKNKDINQYKTVEDVIRALQDTKVRGRKSEEVRKNDTIYEDQDFVIYHPKTKESSCSYGSGASWCIAANGSGNMFSNYVFNQGSDFYFAIDKNRDQDDALQKIAMQYIEHKQNGSEFPIEIFNKNDYHVAGAHFGASSGKASDMSSEEFMQQYFGKSYDGIFKALRKHYASGSLKSIRKKKENISSESYRQLVLSLTDLETLDLLDNEFIEKSLYNVVSFVARNDYDKQVHLFRLIMRAMKYVGKQILGSVSTLFVKVDQMPTEYAELLYKPLADLLKSLKREYAREPYLAFTLARISSHKDFSPEIKKIVFNANLLDIENNKTGNIIAISDLIELSEKSILLLKELFRTNQIDMFVIKTQVNGKEIVSYMVGPDGKKNLVHPGEYYNKKIKVDIYDLQFFINLEPKDIPDPYNIGQELQDFPFRVRRHFEARHAHKIITYELGADDGHMAAKTTNTRFPCIFTTKGNVEVSASLFNTKQTLLGEKYIHFDKEKGKFMWKHNEENDEIFELFGLNDDMLKPYSIFKRLFLNTPNEIMQFLAEETNSYMQKTIPRELQYFAGWPYSKEVLMKISDTYNSKENLQEVLEKRLLKRFKYE